MSSDYYCPISYEIMTDPVICSDGTTYQRENIVRWLQTNNTSPLTGLPLSNLNLIPNLILKTIIREQFPDIDISSTSTSNSSQTNNENQSSNFQNTDTPDYEDLPWILQEITYGGITGRLNGLLSDYNLDNNLDNNLNRNNIINNIIITSGYV